MDHRTQDFYEQRGREWADVLLSTWSLELDPFLDLLSPGARVLELGCGDGRDAERMIARGFAVDPSDGTPGMARLASARPGRVVPVMRFDELEEVEAYDAVWCQASLLHLPENDLPGVLARIHHALVPGGRHWASYKDGAGGSRDRFGRFFSYLPAARLDAAYRLAAPWAELALTTRYDGRSFCGAPTDWHNVLARK